MRLTQFRIHIVPMSDGMLSVAVAEVHYQRGKASLAEILHNDWCTPDELGAVLGPVLDRAAMEGIAIGNELELKLPL